MIFIKNKLKSKIRKIVNLTIFPYILSLAIIFISSQNLLAQEYDFSQKIPLDPKVKIDTLENGLVYYIRENAYPKNRVELRLVINAGSMQENEKQQGLAHFLEHMSFNGTASFEKNDIVDYLQSVGVRFGPHLNAYTSFDETVYKIALPTDSAEVLEAGFQILSEWAWQLSLEAEEIDKERGVVIEEWRKRQGASNRLFEQYFPIIYESSRYAKRLPIGKKEILENFDYQTLKDFYENWYRPDLMAVVVVGDMPQATAQALIEKYFGIIPNKENPPERLAYPVADHEETKIIILSDEEATNSSVEIMFKHEIKEHQTLEDLRNAFASALFRRMLNERFYEIARESEAPFTYAGASYNNIVRTKAAYNLYANVEEGYLLQGLEAILIENQRVRLYSFTEVELERAKTKMLNGLKNAYLEREKTETRHYLKDYINHFLENKAYTSIDFKYEFAQNIFPEITLEEVNQFSEKWVRDDNRVVLMISPQKEGLTLPTETQVLEIINQVESMKLEPYVEKDIPKELPIGEIQAGKIINETPPDEFGIEKLTLSNDIEVWLKVTDFQEDDIQMYAYSLGGQSLYEAEDFNTVLLANGIIKGSGLGEYDGITIEKIVADKNMYVGFGTSSLSEYLRGNSTTEDLESMLQLMYLYITEPRLDKEYFENYINRVKSYYLNEASDPESYFYNEISLALAQNHYSSGTLWTEEDLDAIPAERTLEIFKERFADMGDFKFFFVGNFSKETIKPLIEKYIASLPSEGKSETWKDVGVYFPKESISKNYYKGKEPKATVVLSFYGEEYDYTILEAYYLSSLEEILDIRFTEVLREKESGVYGVSIGSYFQQFPHSKYKLAINFTCSPENVERLIKAIETEIQAIQTNGIGEEYLQKIKETQRRDWEIALQDNSTWINIMQVADFEEATIEEILDYKGKQQNLSSEVVKQTAIKYCNFKQMLQAVLYPESWEEK